jgi:hypothetical protein
MRAYLISTGALFGLITRGASLADRRRVAALRDRPLVPTAHRGCGSSVSLGVAPASAIQEQARLT